MRLKKKILLIKCKTFAQGLLVLCFLNNGLSNLTSDLFLAFSGKVKNLAAMWETHIRSLGQEDPLEKEMATHSSILARGIPWTVEPGGLQSRGSQRVGYD